MNPKTSKLLSVALLFAWHGFAQGTFLYDQQSTNSVEGIAGIQSDQPMGQSFTPSLSMVSFVELNLYDGDIFQNLGATVYVNLRSNSLTGTVLASTTPVFLPDAFFGTTNFFFPTPANIVPGVTYYLQPVSQVGSAGFGSIVTDGSYTGGSLFRFELPVAGKNLWFREGIVVVPEPSYALLVLFGGGVLFYVRRRK